MASIPRGLRQVLQKSPSDIVILSSLRTAITRAKKGGFKDAYPEELLTHVLRATLAANPNLDASHIDDVAIGSVLQELGGAKAGRMAQIHAGFPHTVPFHTINRQCSSGLAAVTSIANGIRSGAIDVGVGGGMESMTRNYGSRAIPTVLWPALKDSPVQDARDCIMPMGITSENVAARYGISRADQDAFAARSHHKAAAAQEAGLFDAEIVPVTTRFYDDAEQNPDAPPREITVVKDDGVRRGVSVEKMASLKPAFSETGSSTAGNSSQVSDGAAATLLMRRSTATELGLTSSIKGRWVATAVAGVAPDEMGVGPAVAIPKLLGQVGLEIADVGIWEINEAFASQALYCVRKLGIDEEKVNPKGGAIALGHPLGATGARQLATLLPELERSGQEIGVVHQLVNDVERRDLLARHDVGSSDILLDNINLTLTLLSLLTASTTTTMRPPVRFLQPLEAPSLQFSKTLYICSSCRHNVPYTYSTQQHQYQQQRHASGETPLTERLRRRIWGTENPPGQKDPYGGEGAIFGSLKSRFGGQQQQQQPAGAVPTEDEAAAAAAAEEAAAKAGRRGSRLGVSKTLYPDFVPATTVEGLKVLGHTYKWGELGPKEQDRYSPFLSRSKARTVQHIRAAAQSAAIEVCILRELNKPMTAALEATQHDRMIWRMLRKCQFRGGFVRYKSLAKAVIYPNEGVKKILHFVFNQLGDRQLERELELSQLEPKQGSNEVVLSKRERRELEESMRFEEPASMSYAVKTPAEPPCKEYHRFPLVNPEVKFAFLARLAQTTGYHIPDSVMTKMKTAKDAIDYLETVITPPKKLADELSALPERQGIPNLTVKFSRYTKADHDRDVGRRKVIEEALREHGLLYEQDTASKFRM